MPGTRDPYEKPVKDHEYLTWTDALRGKMQRGLVTDPQTGEKYDEQRRYLEQRAQERKQEYMQKKARGE